MHRERSEVGPEIGSISPRTLPNAHMNQGMGCNRVYTDTDPGSVTEPTVYLSGECCV
jgi:hypothetical protein